jgi:hypothetical protein
VLQDKQCRNCHSLNGVGGQRGPALDAIASRMTEDQMIRQVLQGGGNMPAYGNALNPAETKALVSFLMTLRGNNLAPAVMRQTSWLTQVKCIYRRLTGHRQRGRHGSVCPMLCSESLRIGRSLSG